MDVYYIPGLVHILCLSLYFVVVWYLSDCPYSSGLFQWCWQGQSYDCPNDCPTVRVSVMKNVGKSITWIYTLMGPSWGPSGADRSQVGPMLAPGILLSGYCTKDSCYNQYEMNLNKTVCIFYRICCNCNWLKMLQQPISLSVFNVPFQLDFISL